MVDTLPTWCTQDSDLCFKMVRRQLRARQTLQCRGASGCLQAPHTPLKGGIEKAQQTISGWGLANSRLALNRVTTISISAVNHAKWQFSFNPRRSSCVLIFFCLKMHTLAPLLSNTQTVGFLISSIFNCPKVQF